MSEKCNTDACERDIQFLGCFKTPRSACDWGHGNAAIKRDGKFEFRPGGNNKKPMSENEMVQECIKFAKPSMLDNPPFVIGLQNGNQCFYRGYDASEYLNGQFRNKYEPYNCNRSEGGRANQIQVYKVFNK